MKELPDPKNPSALTVQMVQKRFRKDGFYAVENYATHGNIHRICEVRAGKVRVHANEWEAVESFFVDYNGEEWQGLITIFLEGFSLHNADVDASPPQ
jgi:hypothetical protein